MSQPPLTFPSSPAPHVYDYVVVGAGSAGCVLAARLSEDPEVSVALVEAGGPDDAQEIHIPVAFGQLFKSRYDWDHSTEPEPGLGGRRAYLPRGRVLGGSSSMNAMIYIRGARADYDGYAAGGATGWGWDDVLPWFLRSEDNERGADAWHATGGPLPVADGRSRSPLADAFVEAAVSAGHPANGDFNAERQDGVGLYQLTQRSGMRASAAAAFLHPALDRPNLTVLTGTAARRLLLEGPAGAPRAVGVEVERAAADGGTGTLEQLRAEREVLVSAGTYGSPHLLQLSGIGPADQLGVVGVPVVVDLPVGQGLQDHWMALMSWLTDTESLTSAMTAQNVELLQTQGRGPLTSNVGEAGGFWRSRPGLEAPDVQWHMAPVLFYDEGLGAPLQHGFSIGPCVLNPTSRGEVVLRSARPDTKPRILHRYLDTEEDRRVVVAGLRATIEIAAQRAVTAQVKEPFSVPTGPGSAAGPTSGTPSDADLLRFARECGQTLYHPTSTCAIGSVVDEQLRVLGVDGLRVVDASVLPSVPRGNTNAPTIMVAERAADLVREGSGT